jgi:sulfur-carrier protein adenylyltransferase/sulfurtransferase
MIISPSHLPAQDSLSAHDRTRYSRQILVPELGEAGQTRLKNASALVVGLGGLGSPVALYLAAAGVGRLGLVDYDVVESSNLQRQILHGTADLGKSKTASAVERIRALNPDCIIEAHDMIVAPKTAQHLIAGTHGSTSHARPYDIVLDCSDNLATRYALNDACVLARTPLVYGAVYRWEGQCAVLNHQQSPCLRCLFPAAESATESFLDDVAPNCDERGVVAPVVGIIGAMQASEALKILALPSNNTPINTGRLHTLNALAMDWATIHFPKHKECSACSETAQARIFRKNSAR